MKKNYDHDLELEKAEEELRKVNGELEEKIGDEIEARVIRVREDGKLDLSPRELAYLQLDKDAELILEKMRILKDSFRFNDKTNPEQIVNYFNMSKKAFKRAIGNLLKQGKIEKTEDGYFKLVNKK